MKVHVATFLSELGGSIDKEHYIRPIPNCPGWGVYCKKPQFNKKEKAQMATRTQVRAFKDITAEAKRIYNNPEMRATWQAKYDVALKTAQKRHPNLIDNNPNKPYIPARLWDFIRQELYQEMKADKA